MESFIIGLGIGLVLGGVISLAVCGFVLIEMKAEWLNEKKKHN